MIYCNVISYYELSADFRRSMERADADPTCFTTVSRLREGGLIQMVRRIRGLKAQSIIVALEDEAKALVKTDGCTSADQCRSAPVGNRACGGPRYYLVYCSRTTDSAALFAKLKAVADAENEFNTRYKIMSTCEFRMPPKVGLVGAACQAQVTGTPGSSLAVPQ